MKRLLLSLLVGGCATRVCGEGTEEKFVAEQGAVVCTAKVAQVQCDPDTTYVSGGMCVGRVVQCGQGTMLDVASQSCVATASSCGPQPRPCPPKPGKFSLAGVIQHLRDGKYATAEMVEVRAYNPIQFLLTGMGEIGRTTITDGSGTYCIDDLPFPGGNLVAIGVTDPGGPKSWALAGIGLDNIEIGKAYRLDGFIVEKDLVAAWNKATGLADGTLEASGAYFARFLDKPRTDESGAKFVGGVRLLMEGMDAPNAFYFKGDLLTVDKAATATDAATGAIVQRAEKGVLRSAYTGKGGTIGGAAVKWDVYPGGSTAGVVFVQKFHPTM